MGTRSRKKTPGTPSKTALPPPPSALPDETRVADLLPPDAPWTPTTRKIAERRIGGIATSERLLLRRARRPAGNSRKFWARVEEDDPFLPPAPGARLPTGDRADAWFDHAGQRPEPAAAGRVPRAEGSRPAPVQRPAPRPAPEAARPAAPRPAPPERAPTPEPPPAARPPRPTPAPSSDRVAQPAPRPSAPRPPPPSAAPEPYEDAAPAPRAPPIPRKVASPTINPDPRRAAPPPPPPTPRAPPPPSAVPTPREAPLADGPRTGMLDRTPPRPLPPPRPQGAPGRVAMPGLPGGPPQRSAVQYPSEPVPPPAVVGRAGKTAAEIRRENERPTGPVLPPKRSLDDVLGILGDLDAGSKVYADRLAELERAKKSGRPLPSSGGGAEGGYYDRPDPRPIPKVVGASRPQPTPAANPTPAAKAPAARPPAGAPPRPPPAGPPPPRPPIAPPPRPASRAAAEDDDDEDMDLPPAPAPRSDAPVNRSPRAAMQGAGGPNLDDLFGGGGQDSRVKIGKRTLPKPKPGEGEAEG